MNGPLADATRALADRVDRLVDDLTTGSRDAETVAKDALGELSDLLEELRVAGEELEVRNEELAATSRELEQERRAFQRQTTDRAFALVTTDARGRILHADAATASLLGVAPPFLRGKPLAVYVRPSDQPELYRTLERLDLDGPPQPLELGLRPRLGPELLAGLSVTTASRPSGAAELRWAIQTEERADRLDEDRSTSQYQSLSTRFQGILDAASDAIVSIDERQRIVLFNRAAEQLFARRSEHVLGRPLREILPVEVRDHHDDLVRGFADGPAERLELGDRPMLRVRRPDGGEIPVEITVSKVKMGAEQVMTAIVRDVTRRRELEQQLVQHAKLETLGRLAGGISHDFNNILSIIRGHLELLADETGLSPGAERRLLAIDAAAQRAAALVGNLTAFAGPGRAAPESLHVNAALEDLGGLLAELIGSNVALELRLEAEPDLVAIDLTELEQVVLNLVLNACDALAAGGGHVTVHTWTERGHLLLEVADDGRGIDPQTLERVFEPFFSTQPTGSGLGLATVKGIVERSAGDIDVASVPGAGSTFTIRLPLVPGSEATAVSTGPIGADEQTATAAADTGARILLVDDELELRDLAADLLTVRGYSVRTAASADDALAALDADPDVDLLVTDVVMPGGDGFSLAAQVTARWPGVRLLFISAHSDQEPGVRLPDLADVPLLRKPFTGDQLVDAVHDRLAR